MVGYGSMFEGKVMGFKKDEGINGMSTLDYMKEVTKSKINSSERVDWEMPKFEMKTEVPILSQKHPVFDKNVYFNKGDAKMVNQNFDKLFKDKTNSLKFNMLDSSPKDMLKDKTQNYKFSMLESHPNKNKPNFNVDSFVGFNKNQKSDMFKVDSFLGVSNTSNPFKVNIFLGVSNGQDKFTNVFRGSGNGLQQAKDMAKVSDSIGWSRIDQQKGLPMFGDADKDGVANILDCWPKNPRLQDFMGDAATDTQTNDYVKSLETYGGEKLGNLQTYDVPENFVDAGRNEALSKAGMNPSNQNFADVVGSEVGSSAEKEASIVESLNAGGNLNPAVLETYDVTEGVRKKKPLLRFTVSPEVGEGMSKVTTVLESGADKVKSALSGVGSGLYNTAKGLVVASAPKEMEVPKYGFKEVTVTDKSGKITVERIPVQVGTETKMVSQPSSMEAFSNRLERNIVQSSSALVNAFGGSAAKSTPEQFAKIAALTMSDPKAMSEAIYGKRTIKQAQQVWNEKKQKYETKYIDVPYEPKDTFNATAMRLTASGGTGGGMIPVQSASPASVMSVMSNVPGGQLPIESKIGTNVETYPELKVNKYLGNQQVQESVDDLEALEKELRKQRLKAQIEQLQRGGRPTSAQVSAVPQVTQQVTTQQGRPNLSGSYEERSRAADQTKFKPDGSPVPYGVWSHASQKVVMFARGPYKKRDVMPQHQMNPDSYTQPEQQQSFINPE